MTFVDFWLEWTEQLSLCHWTPGDISRTMKPLAREDINRFNTRALIPVMFVEAQSIFHLALSKLAECLGLIDSPILSTESNSRHPKQYKMWTPGQSGNEPGNQITTDFLSVSKFCSEVTAVRRWNIPSHTYHTNILDSHAHADKSLSI